MTILAWTTVIALAFLPQPKDATLDAELTRHHVPATGVEDSGRRITSYETLDDAQWFAIAYYWDEGTTYLPETLRIRTYEKRTRRWHYGEFKGPFGSILGLRHGGGWWYVTGHSSPSAAPTLVLTRSLRLVHTLKGWPALVLPDGRLVYEHSLIHFAPAHPGSLGLYDPMTNRDVPLFPAKRIDAGSKAFFINRSFSDLRLAPAPATISVSVDEQDVRLMPDNTGEVVGTPRKLRVSCDLSTTPRCVVRRLVR